MVFPWIFLQFGLGGAGVQIVETRIFLRGTVMKASSHEKHSKEKTKKTKNKKVQTHGQGLGRGLAGDMGLNCLFFWFFHGFLQFGQNLKNTQKKIQTHGQGLGYPHTNQKTKKTKNQETKKPKKQKTKKTKKQKTKKTKKQKNKKPK